MTITIPLNGIKIEDGDYFHRQHVRCLAKYLRRKNPETGDPDITKNVREGVDGQPLPAIAGVDPQDLARAGWGVIFPEHQADRLRPLVRELLQVREAQADGLYRELTYRPGETSFEFLERYKGSTVIVDPKRIPFHLLIVGDPTTIPFAFQYNLALPHSVGRLWFDDPQSYQRYTANLLRAEARDTEKPRMRFWGPKHVGDPCTKLSRQILIDDLALDLASELGDKARFCAKLPPNKQELLDMLGGATTPEVLFTASHGLVCRADHPNLRDYQGALLCGDWPGPELAKGQPLAESHYLSADHIADDAQCNGLLVFMFGCFSGGCPQFDNFPTSPERTGEPLAPHPFLASLPSRLLALENGCAGVVAHVDCAYFWSFTDLKQRPQTALYRDCFRRVLEGEPVGSALNGFNLNFALKDIQYREQQLKERIFGPHAFPRDDQQLVNLWHAINDSRNFLLLGDPAFSLKRRSTS
ncbi:hypothetical protein SCOR_28580 [Sulfidibacter corallicola]|uniref:Uncharacterized protein n=1 Tax=Sulfidibacter corallicola TaxID=2818388 RepID=A0A8A4TLZ6_SULCO|nr:hypothetical protein [Sulfidibacter corallicola]QTD50487.1 hypothetical protein J3U87_33300 [Sulfidibacter corallicola]